jgi:hypothetical protein
MVAMQSVTHFLGVLPQQQEQHRFDRSDSLGYRNPLQVRQSLQLDTLALCPRCS